MINLEEIEAIPELFKVYTYLKDNALKKKKYCTVKSGRGHNSIELHPGQLVTSRNELAEALKMKPSTIWLRLTKIRDMGLIALELKKKTRMSIVTILENETPKQKRKEPKSADFKPQRVKKESSSTNPKDKQILRTITDYWMDKFKEKTGEPYLFQAKDGAILAKILKNYGQDKTINLIFKFFSQEDEWLERVGYDTGKLIFSIPKLLTRKDSIYERAKRANI